MLPIGGLENASSSMNQSLSSVNCTIKPVMVHSQVFPWIYLLLALLGFLTNGLVFLDLRRTKRKPTIIFAQNILVSDVLQCVSLLFRMAFYYNGNRWEAQDPMCGVAIFVSVTIFYINVYCNMCFLLWISISRYSTVVQSHRAALQNFRNAHWCSRICQTTWLAIVLVIGSHMAYKEIRGYGTPGSCFDHMNNRKKTNSNGVFAIGLVVFYPMLVVMLSSYALLLYHLQRVHKSSQVSQTKGSGGGLKVKRKVLASVLVLLACFLPYHIQRSTMLLSGNPQNCDWVQENFRIKTNTILVAAFNCCLNPILHLVFRLPCCRGRRPVGAGVHDAHFAGLSDTPT